MKHFKKRHGGRKHSGRRGRKSHGNRKAHRQRKRLARFSASRGGIRL